MKPAAPWAPAVLAGVAIGGAVGALLRYGVTLGFTEAGSSIAAGVLLINVVGSFALGALVFGVAERRDLGPAARAALGPGLLGGFTTFSGVSELSRGYLAGGDSLLALAYAVATAVACVAAVLLARSVVTGADR